MLPTVKLTALVFLTCVALAAPAQATGDTEIGQELRTLQEPAQGPLNTIELIGAINLTVIQGITHGVTLAGRAEDRARVQLETHERGLRIIYPQSGGLFSWRRDSSPSAALAVPQLRQLVVKGSGEARIVRFDQKDTDLRVQIDGSGDIHIEHLKTRSLRAGINGSGDIKASGEAGQQIIEINGSGDYAADALKTSSAKISIRGSGDAQLNVSEALEVDIAGSGDVSYSGSPRLIKSIRGSGEVIQRGTK